mmetsp:Transcript_66453/g.134905  ORF Transcript_66453/g.134905 Transcript_66453/m.134905 type:complete len:367 (+) Transcript_66453:330-1430(+)
MWTKRTQRNTQRMRRSRRIRRIRRIRRTRRTSTKRMKRMKRMKLDKGFELRKAKTAKTLKIARNMQTQNLTSPMKLVLESPKTATTSTMMTVAQTIRKEEKKRRRRKKGEEKEREKVINQAPMMMDSGCMTCTSKCWKNHQRPKRHDLGEAEPQIPKMIWEKSEKTKIGTKLMTPGVVLDGEARVKAGPMIRVGKRIGETMTIGRAGKPRTKAPIETREAKGKATKTLRVGIPKAIPKETMEMTMETMNIAIPPRPRGRGRASTKDTKVGTTGMKAMKAIRKVTEKDLRDLRDPSGMAPNGTWMRSRMASGSGSPAPKSPASLARLASLSLGTTTEEMEEMIDSIDRKTREARKSLGRLGDQLDVR